MSEYRRRLSVWFVYAFICTLGTMQQRDPYETNKYTWSHGDLAPTLECLNEATLIGPAAVSSENYTVSHMYYYSIVLYFLYVSISYEWCSPLRVVNPPTLCGHG